MRRAAAVLLVAATALTGCEGGDSTSTKILSDTLTIYASVPLRGADAGEGRAFLRGAKLALDEAGGRVGELDIGLVTLDDTHPKTSVADFGRAAQNARLAAENPSTIAYLGELVSYATMGSLPITNEIGILQVSAGSATALDAPGLYPSGLRTLARLTPTSADEARALAAWVARTADSAVVMQDGGDDLGRGTELERALQDAGVEVVEVLRADPVGLEAQAGDLAAGEAEALVYAGKRGPGLSLLRAVDARAPRMQLFASSGIAPDDLAQELPDVTVRVTSLTRPVPAGSPIAGRYERLFGEPAPPAALLGHAAMQGVLQAIAAGGADRRKVLDAYLAQAASRQPAGPFGYIAGRGAVRFAGPLD